MTLAPPASIRDRLGAALRASRLLAALELSIVPLMLALKSAGVLRNPVHPIFLFGWLSLWLRRSGWRQVGMAWPANGRRTVLAALAIGLAYNALDIGVVIPLLHRWTGEPLELGSLDSLQQLGPLLLWVAAMWPLAAFAEEMTFRGYLLNRLVDVFGKSVWGWTLSAVLVCSIFGFVHTAQGITGVLDNVLAGVLFLALYLLSGRNLWLPILVHGVVDTSSAVALYLGLVP